MTKNLFRGVLLLVGLLLLIGCSHDLSVRNLQTYTNLQATPLKKPLTVGITSSTDGQFESGKLVKAVADSLQRYSATVISPYDGNSPRKADVIANIALKSDYSGSGVNFLIDFPGFIIFTPAWNGYVYHADYDFSVSLINTADNSSLDSWSVPIHLNLRHAEFDRTWTTGAGWIITWLAPLFGGCYTVSYDNDVTPLLMRTVENPIGDYIAHDIIERINKHYRFLPEQIQQQK